MERTQPLGALQRAASSIRRFITRSRDDGDGREEPREVKSTEPPRPARAPRREADIPFDRIEQAYTPTQTSVKAPFRTSGADQTRDQEFANGVADERWSDEDRLTNKSGDPRIGTHGRTYEPGERGGE